MSDAGGELTLLVGPEELSGWGPRVVLADVRWYLDGRSGRAEYEAGHLPGARFVDLDRDLAEAGDPRLGRHPLPSPEQFARRLGTLGIANGTPVVAYDDTGGGTASRLVWMLRAIGEPAALLDGGITAFTGRLETGAGPDTTPVEREATPWPPDLLAEPDELGAALLLDARAPERYRGEVELVDPRPGHIPGARNLPWTSLLDPASGRFAGREEMRALFAGVGAAADREVIMSCGSGVTACALALGHELAGLGRPRLFVASYSGWSADPGRDVETTDGPG